MKQLIHIEEGKFLKGPFQSIVTKENSLATTSVVISTLHSIGIPSAHELTLHSPPSPLHRERTENYSLQCT